MPIRIDGDNATATPGITGGDADTGLVFGTNEIEAVTGGTTRFTVESNGNVTIENGNLVLASGSGIDFSATADAAGMTSELLDDYEEGVYTPTFTCGTSGSITLQPGFDTFAYEKVGNVVHVHGRVRVDSVSSPTGGLQISLPFTRQQIGEDAERLTGVLFIQNASSEIRNYGIHPTSITYSTKIDLSRIDGSSAVLAIANNFSGDELVAVNLTYRAV